MRRASSSGDDHTNAATSRITGVIGRPVRRPMRRSHVDLVVNSKIVQRFSRLTHDLEIGITAHHNRNQWLAHLSSALLSNRRNPYRFPSWSSCPLWLGISRGVR